MVLTQPSRLLDRPLPLCHGPVPAPRRHIPSNGGRFTRHQRGFTQLTRPVVPSPVAARIERAALGLSPGFAPRRPGAGRRTPGRGQAIEHGPGTTRSTSHQSILQSVVHSQRATSRRTTNLSSADMRCANSLAAPSRACGRLRPYAADARSGRAAGAHVQTSGLRCNHQPRHSLRWSLARSTWTRGRRPRRSSTDRRRSR